MGWLDKLSGSSINFDPIGGPFGKGVTGSAMLGLFSNPQWLQAMSLSAAAGLNPFEELAQFALKKKDLPKGALKSEPGKYLQVGKGKFVDIGGLVEYMPTLNAKAEEHMLSQAQASLEKIKATPAFATVAAMSEGKFSDDYMNAVNKNFNAMASQKLGTVGAKGFLHDPNKAAQPILEASELKSQYLTDKQLQAEEMLKAAAGFPGALGFTPGALGNPTNAGSFVGPLFNISQMVTDINKFNATGNFQESQLQQAAFTDLFGTLMGGGMGLMQMNQQQAGLDKILGSMGGGGGGGMGGFMSMLPFLMTMCSVAEELWGKDDPRTQAARRHVAGRSDEFSMAYREHGRQWADALRNDPELRSMAEDLWSDLARKGWMEPALGAV